MTPHTILPHDWVFFNALLIENALPPGRQRWEDPDRVRFRTPPPRRPDLFASAFLEAPERLPNRRIASRTAAPLSFSNLPNSSQVTCCRISIPAPPACVSFACLGRRELGSPEPVELVELELCRKARSHWGCCDSRSQPGKRPKTLNGFIFLCNQRIFAPAVHSCNPITNVDDQRPKRAQRERPVRRMARLGDALLPHSRYPPVKPVEVVPIRWS